MASTRTWTSLCTTMASTKTSTTTYLTQWKTSLTQWKTSYTSLQNPNNVLAALGATAALLVLHALRRHQFTSLAYYLLGAMHAAALALSNDQ